jgi:phosphoglycolate phosphatase-like HAD superfamily hydrolase
MSAPGNRIEADPSEAIFLGDTAWDVQAADAPMCRRRPCSAAARAPGQLLRW